MRTKIYKNLLVDSREVPRVKLNSRKLKLKEKRKPSRNLRLDSTYLNWQFIF
jgi:hypothetical protein